MTRSLYVLLALVAGTGLILFNPIGAFVLGFMACLFWLWIVIDEYVTQRHERKIAEKIAAEKRARGPAIQLSADEVFGDSGFSVGAGAH
jgi:hypothetical protein